MDGVAALPAAGLSTKPNADSIHNSSLGSFQSSSSSSHPAPSTSNPASTAFAPKPKDSTSSSTSKIASSSTNVNNHDTKTSIPHENLEHTDHGNLEKTLSKPSRTRKKTRRSGSGKNSTAASASASAVSTPKAGTPRPEKGEGVRSGKEDVEVIVLSSGSDGEASKETSWKGKARQGESNNASSRQEKNWEERRRESGGNIDSGRDARNEESKAKAKARKKERDKARKRKNVEEERQKERKRRKREDREDRDRDREKSRGKERERRGRSLSLNGDLEIIDVDTDEEDGSKGTEERRRKKKSRTEFKSFGESVDFIPLDDNDSNDEMQKIYASSSSSKKRKGKERAREDGSDDGEKGDFDRNGRGDSSRKRRRSRSRSWERDERERSRDRDRDRRGRDRSPPLEREWDRGKRKRDDDRFDRLARRAPPAASASVRSLSDRKLPWIEGLDFDRCRNVAELLHMEVEAFTKWISPSPIEDEIRSLLVTWITRVITQRFPDATVLPFGSYATKLYLPTGDIDLVILSDTMAYNPKQTVLRTLADTIKRNNIANNISIIAKAKVPIIKFVTKTEYGGVPVDISINQPNGEVGARIVGGFLKDMKVVSSSPSSSMSEDGEVQSPSSVLGSHLEGSLALRALIVLTKQFLSQRSMNEVYTGGLSSYSITILVISFLQMHPKIRRGEINPEKNLGAMIMDFFELYGSYFNYDNVGISVRDGGRYFSKRKRGWYQDNRGGKGGGGPLLSIEDPADPSNDISSGSYAFQKVRTTFAGAYNILKATAFLKAGIISSRMKGTAMRLRHRDRDAVEEDDMSILGHILDVGQNMINQRRMIREVYDKRTLHRLLGIRPRPVVVDATPSFNSKGGNTVNGHAKPTKVDGISRVWTVTADDDDSDTNPDSSPVHKGSSRSVTASRSRRQVSDDDEDEGRYAIGKEPPVKRRKTGGRGDHEIVGGPVSFTTDDDSDTGDDTGSDADSLMEEEREYDLDSDFEHDDGKVKGDNSEKPQSRDDRKRSYWLSKGIGD
ncbi:hypothetical protein K435DRAFT_831962 [Dendrothele bispora CBS 962.96]|uniref:polynucleotide adenylyltransferase n=1 Tax=Dendrothele bispora (strain CBS 962.96) TaxID=1314807 RepID=A0A4S8KXB3_DENBC|nr:hypothetical protein K435DRAFT_831962 [Dendrothele bispora CBS 962.96]